MDATDLARSLEGKEWLSRSGPAWDRYLRALTADKVLSGYALLTVSGRCEKAVGFCTSEYQTQEPLPPSAKQALDPFVGIGEPPTTFSFFGKKLMVFYRSGRSYYAIAHRRELGVGICRLPFGVLLVSFKRNRRPQDVIPRVEYFCDMMWN